MPWGVVAAAVIGGAIQADAAGDAADAQSDAARASGARSDRQYADTQRNLQPYMDAGTTALGQYSAVNAGDYSNFMNSPDYLYAVQSGTQALDRGAAAGGGLWGGGADADRIKLGQGLATQNLGTYMQRLMGIAGLGQNSAVSLGQFGAQNVTNQGNALMGAANAQAQGSINTANAYNNAINSAVQGYGNMQAGGKSQYAQPASGGQWGNFAPNQQGQWGQAALGPSNGTNWNFG